MVRHDHVKVSIPYPVAVLYGDVVLKKETMDKE